MVSHGKMSSIIYFISVEHYINGAVYPDGGSLSIIKKMANVIVRVIFIAKQKLIIF